MSELIDALKARAEAANRNVVRQSVDIDIATYEKVALFIEQEGCNLKEGLRRAVRMGIEALLLERAPVIEQDYGPAFVPPPLPGLYTGQTQYEPSTSVVDDEPSEGDFTRIAPPGL